MRVLEYKDYENLFIGSKIFGCGGGGDPEKAKKYLERLSKKNIQLVQLDELSGDSTIFTVFMIGSSASLEKIPKSIFDAKNKLEKMVGTLDAIIPVEIGPGAVFEALYYASEYNLPLIDADIVGGRSAPEVYLETITITNIKRTPMILINNNDEMIILKNINDWRRLEQISRGIATISGGYMHVIGYPMKVSDVKNILVKGSITKAIELGDYIRKGRISNALKKYGGSEIFKGTIKKVEKENRGGFLVGTSEIEGKEIFSNLRLKIWFKNENLISWIDNKKYVTCPDLICITDKNYNGIYNRDLEVGKDVVVIGIPADKLWRSKDGLNIFNPKTFGFNMDYTPMKESVNKALIRKDDK